MSSQWRPLQPEMSSNGSLSPLQFGRPVSRQITKNPQNIMQNFQQQQQQQSNGFNAFNFNPSPPGNNGSPSAMPTSASTSRLSSLMGNNSSAFDFGMETGFRSSAGFSSGGGARNMPNMSMNHGNPGSSQGNGFSGLFDRSMSGYEGGGGRSSGFDRQMSVPANLADQGKMNGFGQHKFGSGSSGDRGGYNNSENFFHSGFNRSSPPQQRSGFNDMKIGTWNEGGSGAGANNQGGMNGAGNGGHAGGNGGNFPSVGTFEIGTFNIGNSNNGGQSGSSSRHNGFNNDQHPPGPGHRETGIIEKLLHSYGFIQCCDRQARLFFHFSQFDGNIEHLKIGDPVEFEMTYDRRTGKPIASSVSKIAPEVVMREERVVGTVTTDARVDPETGGDTQGRISYENRGECFFLPFTTKDVEGNVTVAAGDKVSFQIATMARSGNLVARTIRLENPAAPVKYQGVVNSIQEDKSFGFIERADVVREIFFRNTDLEDGVTIDLGTDSLHCLAFAIL